MTDYKQGFQGPYVTAVQIGDATPTLTIRDVILTEIPAMDPDKPNRERWVVYYDEDKKGMVLNLTNALCLVALWGRNVKKWKGHRVTLHTTPVRVGGKMEPGIRILGTPEIDAPREVSIKLPRKRAFSRTLQPTGRRKPTDGADGHMVTENAGKGDPPPTEPTPDDSGDWGDA